MDKKELKKELKKDLIEVGLRILFNPSDSHQIKFMEKVIEIFNKHTTGTD